MQTFTLKLDTTDWTLPIIVLIHDDGDKCLIIICLFISDMQNSQQLAEERARRAESDCLRLQDESTRLRVSGQICMELPCIEYSSQSVSCATYTLFTWICIEGEPRLTNLGFDPVLFL